MQQLPRHHFAAGAGASRRLNRAFNLLADYLVYPKEEEKSKHARSAGLN
jgi:hypothetical protein